MKRYLLLLIVFSFSSLLFAQKVDPSLLEGIKPRSIGPAGMSGRVTSIAVELMNPETIYVGTASGGLWRSESGGTDWVPLFDEQGVISIGAVTLNQNNPYEIWAGTGEGNPRNSHNSGKGIYKSIDRGKTWKLMGLENTRNIHRIIIDNNDPNTVYVAAMGSAWGPSEDRGIYKTTNGGESWEKIHYINDQTGCAELVVDPINPNKMIAAMWEFHREPWFFTSGGEGSGIYVTFDGGESWEKRGESDGLPKGNLGRCGLAICHSKPEIVYALVEAEENALYRSEDGGFKWKKVATKNIGNRPFYYAEIYVDPKNENRIYNLFSLVTRSEDGGRTFETLLPYSGAHPDHHAFWIHPEDPDYLIDGNDGGINISRDRGKTWRFVENLPVGQFYHINYDMDIPYNLYGGMQDNGSWAGPAYVWKQGGIRNSYWKEVLFGDGFDVMPQPNDNRYGYAMYQGGNIHRYDIETGDDQDIQPVHPEGKPLRFNWNAAMAQDPFNENGIWFGSQYVHYSPDRGNNWEILSPDLSTNDTSKQKQAKSGGLTIDATRAENFTTILVIAPSPHDKNVVWAGTDDGNLQLTRDRGKTWNNLSGTLPGLPAGSYIPFIEVSPHNPAEAYVVANNYRRNDWQPYLYRTRDYGATWQRLVDENDVDGHTLAIVQDPVEPGLLFLGTDHGLWFSIDGGENWNKWGKGYPSVSTRDIKIHPRENDLILGTFGRSAWIIDNIAPLREIAASKANVLGQAMALFDVPDAYMSSWSAADGVRFHADAVFRGDNRQSGALMTCWVNPDFLNNRGPWEEKKEATEEATEKDKKAGSRKDKKPDQISDEAQSLESDSTVDPAKKEDKISVLITDIQGDTVRNYKVKADTCMNRFQWDLRKNGVRWPSHEDPKEDENPPSGNHVMPGDYWIKVSFRGERDSAKVTVHPDPRSDFDVKGEEARQSQMARMYQLLEAATSSFNRLKEIEKSMNRVDNAIALLEDSLKKDLKDNAKVLSDSIAVIKLKFISPKEEKGYDHVTQRLNNKVWDAISKINSSPNLPGSNAMNAMAIAEKEIRVLIERVNKLLENEWVKYKDTVDALDFSLYKTMDPVKIEGDK